MNKNTISELQYVNEDPIEPPNKKVFSRVFRLSDKVEMDLEPE